jgi:hypothetical protein
MRDRPMRVVIVRERKLWFVEHPKLGVAVAIVAAFFFVIIGH